MYKDVDSDTDISFCASVQSDNKILCCHQLSASNNEDADQTAVQFDLRLRYSRKSSCQ